VIVIRVIVGRGSDCLMLSPVAKLNRICALIRLDRNKIFHWGITDNKGIWLQTHETINNVDFRALEKNIALIGYDIISWETNREEFIIRLQEKKKSEEK
jgi:hypothetical protein